MGVVSTSTPYLPSDGGLASGLLVLQFLNQLCTHQNNTTQYTEKDVQHCIESLKQEEKRRNQVISQKKVDYSELAIKYLDLQNISVEMRRESARLSESLEECELDITALNIQVKEEMSARMVCERDAKLQEALEQMGKEMHEMRNSGLSDEGKINQTLKTLQFISQKQNIEKNISMLQNQLKFANEALKNSTEMHEMQARELQIQRMETLSLQAQNAHLEISLLNLQKQQYEQNETFEAELQRKAEELKTKDERLQKKDEELETKDWELQQRDERLKTEEQKRHETYQSLKMTKIELKKTSEHAKLKDEELKKMQGELRRKQVELEKKNEELKNMDEELKKKDVEPQKKDEELKKKTRN